MPGDARGGLAGLVALEVSDEVPFQIEVGERVDLRGGFLNAVLPEDPLAGNGGRAYYLRADGFGNSDEGDGGGVSICAMRRRSDAAAHVGEIVGDVRAARHPT
jgi:hypothetical protein